MSSCHHAAELPGRPKVNNKARETPVSWRYLAVSAVVGGTVVWALRIAKDNKDKGESVQTRKRPRRVKKEKTEFLPENRLGESSSHSCPFVDP